MGVRIGVGIDEFDDNGAVGVVVGICENHLIFGVTVESSEQVLKLYARLDGFECGRVESAQQSVLRYRSAQFRLELLARGVLQMVYVVHAHSSHIMHIGGVLAQLNHAAAIFFGFGEVNVAHLGDAVADAFVVSTAAHGTAGDVGNGNAQNQRSACHGKHLISVAENEQQVGLKVAQSARHAVHALAHSHHGVDCRVGVDRHRHHAVDVQTVALNFVPSASKLLAEVHIGSHYLQSDVGALIESLCYGAEYAPIGSCAGNDANFSMVHLLKLLLRCKINKEKGKKKLSVGQTSKNAASGRETNYK